jgi:hypothetical protein
MPDLFGDERRAIARKREADESFNAFWSRYPKKVGRLDAVKAWNKLRPDAATVNAILEALEWQIDQWDDLRYCPHPATWIRSERWTDEKPEAADAPTMSKASAAVFRLMK